MTMEASDIFSKFQYLWRAGTNARLNFECHAGQVWMSFHVHIPNAPPHQQQQHHRRRPGPSRLRRAVVLEKQKHEKEQLKKPLKVTTSSQPHPIAM